MEVGPEVAIHFEQLNTLARNSQAAKYNATYQWHIHKRQIHVTFLKDCQARVGITLHESTAHIQRIRQESGPLRLTSRNSIYNVLVFSTLITAWRWKLDPNVRKQRMVRDGRVERAASSVHNPTSPWRDGSAKKFHCYTKLCCNATIHSRYLKVRI